jgi:hypothetical protein
MNPVQDRGANRNTGPALSAGAPLILTGFTVADRSHYVHQAASCCSSVNIPDPNSLLGTTFLARLYRRIAKIPPLCFALSVFRPD